MLAEVRTEYQPYEGLFIFTLFISRHRQKIIILHCVSDVKIRIQMSSARPA